METLFVVLAVIAIFAVFFGIGYLCAQSPGFSALALLISLLTGSE